MWAIAAAFFVVTCACPFQPSRTSNAFSNLDPVDSTLDPLVAANAYLSQSAYIHAGNTQIPKIYVSYRWSTIELHYYDTVYSEPLINQRFNDLKMLAHLPLTVFTILFQCTDLAQYPQPTSLCVGNLTQYAPLLEASRRSISPTRFTSLARQLNIHSVCADFVRQVLQSNHYDSLSLIQLVRSVLKDIMQNTEDAARIQIENIHNAMMKWKSTILSKEEDWNAMKIAVSTSHLARQGNIASQYFARLFSIVDIESSDRVWVFEEFSLEKVKNLIKTEVVDQEISVGFFDDPRRMYVDVLSDGARKVLDEMFGINIDK